jgi:hypothetical protein
MKNYFSDADVNWNVWSPQRMIFKSGALSKKLMPKENLLSYSSKGDRNNKMAKKHGFKVGNSQCAVHVHLKYTDNDFPSAHIDFLDWSDRTYSNGERMQRIDTLVYIDSCHNQWDWARNAQGNWTKVSKGNPLPTDEGYLIAYGGQGQGNYMNYQTFTEMFQITESVRRFLMDVAIPFKSPNHYSTLDVGESFSIA